MEQVVDEPFGAGTSRTAVKHKPLGKPNAGRRAVNFSWDHSPSGWECCGSGQQAECAQEWDSGVFVLRKVPTQKAGLRCLQKRLKLASGLLTKIRPAVLFMGRDMAGPRSD